MDLHREDGPLYWKEPLKTWGECDYPDDDSDFEDEGQENSQPSSSGTTRISLMFLMGQVNGRRVG